MPKNVIQHIEWTTRDPKRLQKFFGKVFDWKFRKAMPGYTMIEGVGGIFGAPDAAMPISVIPYVNVADLDKAERAITAGGGKIHKSKQPVQGMGAFTMFSDPDGNLLALWQAEMKPAPRKAPARKKPASHRATGRRTRK